MFEPSVVLLVTGFLLFASILTSRVFDRIGVPVLIVFLCIGMLSGSEGPGGIDFNNAELANLVGTVALAFILFSGGLDTNWQVVRPVAFRGVILSTLGVLITAVLLGLFAWAALGFTLLGGLLLGSIISSTDAAAVFSILRRRGVSLRGYLKPLLELESGSNDPMALFLTLGVTRVLTEPDFDWKTLPLAFVMNMAIGIAVGLGSGKFASMLFSRARLDYEGLYPVLSLSLVLLTFGLAEFFSGNGYLAVYLCGMLLNGTDFAYKRYTSKFHDGVAWLMQITLFLVLGLLVYPSQLLASAGPALLAAIFLMFVARPVAVFVGLWRSQFSWRERLLVSWTGLRGAVPIVLATFPLTAGYEGSDVIFNMVFFGVLTSVMLQGTLLMPVARLLKVDKPLEPPPRFSLEIERQGQTQGETREIEILPHMAAAGRTLADLGLPPDALILLIGRGDGYVVPRGQTRIEPYDTLLLFGKPATLRAAAQMVESPPPRRRVIPPDDPLAALPMSTDEKYLSKQVVLVGFGRVGRLIWEALVERGIPVVVAEQDRSIVEDLRARGMPAVAGDASTAMVLAQAHVARAAMLIIAIPETMKVRQISETARIMNPSIEVVIRTHSEMEANLLENEEAGKVFYGERELALSMTRYVLNRMRQPSDSAETTSAEAASAESATSEQTAPESER